MIKTSIKIPKEYPKPLADSTTSCCSLFFAMMVTSTKTQFQNTNLFYQMIVYPAILGSLFFIHTIY